MCITITYISIVNQKYLTKKGWLTTFLHLPPTIPVAAKDTNVRVKAITIRQQVEPLGTKCVGPQAWCYQDFE